MKAEYAGGCLSKKKKVLLASLQSSIGQILIACWTQKLNREDYGVDKYKYWVLLAVVKV